MTNMEKRKAMHGFCSSRITCSSCPIAQYDKGHRCGRGKAFLLSEDSGGEMTDLEVLGAYTLAFPEEKEADELQVPTVTLMNTIPCGTIISVDSKQKISTINIMFQEDEE